MHLSCTDIFRINQIQSPANTFFADMPGGPGYQTVLVYKHDRPLNGQPISSGNKVVKPSRQAAISFDSRLTIRNPESAIVG